MKIRRLCRSNRAAGFTLFEVLVAMTMMVGILAALATVTSQWLPNWNRGFVNVQRTELFGRGLERLVADVSSAEFITANGKANQPLFEGRELSVQFVRSAIGPNTKPGLEFIRVTTMSDAQGVALVRTRRPFVTLPSTAKISDVPGFSDPVVLMQAPFLATFSYAGPDRSWRNTWLDAGQLPIAVRITIRDAATDRALAVSTATILHVNVTAECARAKVPRDCVYPPPSAPPKS